MKKTLLLFYFLGIFLVVPKVLAQEISIPKDPKDFRTFLQIQKEVPGLGYRLLIPDSSIDSTLLAELDLQIIPTDSGQLSGVKENFELFGLLPNDSLGFQVIYTVFEQATADSAAQEYLANLVRNGDFVPRTEIQKPQNDLVALAIHSPYIPVFGNKYTFTADIKLFIVTSVIFTFFIFAFGMFVYMLVLRAKKNRKEELEAEYDQMIVDPLTSILFDKSLEEIKQMKMEELNSFFPNELVIKPIYREVLIDRIIGLNKKMKGDFKDKLKTLYHKLGLAKVSVDKIKLRSSSKWHIVADGLVEINEMDLVEFVPEVKKLTNSSNFHVRSLAVAAMLNLSQKSDLSFLRDQTYPLSDWQQMNYLRIIKFVSQSKELKIEMLFESQNPSIRSFGLKLVRMLGRVDLLEKLSQIAPKLGDEEKVEVLKVYREFGAHMEVDFVNDCLRSSNKELMTQAIKAARVVGNEQSVEILESLLLNENDFHIKMLILKSIHELNDDKFQELTIRNTDSSLFKMRKHILDPKLSHV
ncbi:hypothetical protein DFQ04_0542 [Algoriphagus boseongensis]|uniref:HEAT repeat protein n=1 Tax=Algoriphagus boseongensis TaxID=1442587 RepID=A0A4R6T7T1_9BACT|nr:hypothetical protein [Algoriphagus boseongensis]TDQ18736.1 hypothetical protein DFQ04_0542 [Algoriphagus boseongensis]